MGVGPSGRKRDGERGASAARARVRAGRAIGVQAGLQYGDLAAVYGHRGHGEPRLAFICTLKQGCKQLPKRKGVGDQNCSARHR